MDNVANTSNSGIIAPELAIRKDVKKMVINASTLYTGSFKILELSLYLKLGGTADSQGLIYS